MGITFQSEVLFQKGRFLQKDNSIIYLWVGHGRPNSFYANSYDHFKLTQLYFPLTGCKFSTYGPQVYLQTMLVIHRSFQRVVEGSLDRRSRITDRRLSYGPSFDLRTVSPSAVQDLTYFSRLKFLGVYDPIDGCAGRTLVQATIHQCHRWQHLQIFLKN